MKKVIIGLFALGTMVMGCENLDTSLDQYSMLIAKVIDKTELAKREKTIDNVLAVEQAMKDAQAQAEHMLLMHRDEMSKTLQDYVIELYITYGNTINQIEIMKK